jgi:soluble lytic murein transglycosylase-like protein
VARDLSRRVDLPWSGVETRHSPQLNFRLGILYYKEMMDRFDGDAHKALTAYNYGPTRVSRQLRDGTYRNSRYSREILDLYSRLRGTPVRATDRT